MPIRRWARATTRRCRTPTCAPPHATARRPRATPGRPTCTIPSSRAGCTASGFRRCSCGATADRILSEPYGRAYARPIPGARFETIGEGRPLSPSRAAGGVRAPRSRLHRRTLRHENLSLQRASLSRRLERPARLSARRPAESRAAIPKRAADLFHRYYDEYLLADELGLDLMLNEHHQTATCMNSTVDRQPVGAGAADQARTPPDPRLSDRPPARSAARRRGAFHHRRDLARPARHGLHQGRAVRVRAARTPTRSG